MMWKHFNSVVVFLLRSMSYELYYKEVFNTHPQISRCHIYTCQNEIDLLGIGRVKIQFLSIKSERRFLQPFLCSLGGSGAFDLTNFIIVFYVCFLQRDVSATSCCLPAKVITFWTLENISNYNTRANLNRDFSKSF